MEFLNSLILEFFSVIYKFTMNILRLPNRDRKRGL